MRRYLAALAISLLIACELHLVLLAQTSTSAPSSTSASAPAASRPASAPSKEELLRRAKIAVRTNEQVIALFKAGKYDKARDILLKCTKDDPDDYIAWYNLACAYSRLNDTDGAIGALYKSIQHGYSDFQHLQRDSDMDNIRASDGYKTLMARKDEIIQTRAEMMLKRLRKQFGEGYLYDLDKDSKLVVATNIDQPTLDDLKGRLKAQAQALWNDLFSHKFDQYVTVVISKTRPEEMGDIGGFYNHEEHTLVAKTIGMTVVHEFTHALHAADQDGLGQEHPIWILEGLATLYESSQVKDGHIYPQDSHRLTYLKALVRRKQLVPWADLFKMDQGKFMDKAVVAYPESRYIFMYLYRTGKLKKWYDLYTEMYEKDPTGAAAFEKVFGKKLPDIQQDWIAWLDEQKAPPVALSPRHAYIGVRTEAQTDGISIVQIVPGSGADRAGLAVGDTIFKVDGQETIDPEDLVALVDAHIVGDHVAIQYRRDGKYYTAKVTLMSMPRSAFRPGRSQPAGTRPASTAPASQQTSKRAA